MHPDERATYAERVVFRLIVLGVVLWSFRFELVIIAGAWALSTYW